MLKTRLIVQNVKPSLSHYRGIMHGFRKIWKAEGFLALYKGLLPTFLGVVITGLLEVSYLAYGILDSSIGPNLLVISLQFTCFIKWMSGRCR
ncbi:hypothetical protein OS493_040223 [Desmophyllum pertusum]|uniref:Uncharacterized protein n=1 Tax=Desmophyllum pertusum TaxID=174260 RepID=A0A9X0CZU6_9CNID|nr:hypothetical protein OS493_040223 [Desmophyllum pertusum]